MYARSSRRGALSQDDKSLSPAGLGLALLGFSYAVCALLPGLFIPEKVFDPKAVEPSAVPPRTA